MRWAPVMCPSSCSWPSLLDQFTSVQWYWFLVFWEWLWSLAPLWCNFVFCSQAPSLIGWFIPDWHLWFLSPCHPPPLFLCIPMPIPLLPQLPSPLPCLLWQYTCEAKYAEDGRPDNSIHNTAIKAPRPSSCLFWPQSTESPRRCWKTSIIGLEGMKGWKTKHHYMEKFSEKYIVLCCTLVASDWDFFMDWFVVIHPCVKTKNLRKCRVLEISLKNDM